MFFEGNVNGLVQVKAPARLSRRRGRGAPPPQEGEGDKKKNRLGSPEILPHDFTPQLLTPSRRNERR
jgi:hypothetical protein